MANSIFSYDNILPGVITEIDSQYEAGYDTSLFGTTDSIVVCGTAATGPVGFPTPVYSMEHAHYLYGGSYDSASHREFSLTVAIANAMAHGARTVYGCRINGIDLQKLFNLREKSNFQLRLQSRYPANIEKQCYFQYDGTKGAEKFVLYKPAELATIQEKMRGNVESADSMLKIEISLADDYQMSKADKLVNAINLFNNHRYNNCLELDIVDSEGRAVTFSEEAKEIRLGALYDGVYFLGRGESACDKVTSVVTRIVIGEEEDLPYKDFSGNSYKTIAINTDVSQPLPISFSLAHKGEFLEICGVGEFEDLLENAGASSLIFKEDEVDYAETNLSEYDKYIKLGRGFATTCHLLKRVDKDGNELTPKVVESEIDDKNRIIATGDGIFSILEDSPIRYRVMANDICADTVITGKILKPEAFKETSALYGTLLSGNIVFKSKVASDDKTSAKSYEFHVYNHDEIPVMTKEEIYTDKIAKTAGYVSDAEELKELVAKEGEIAFVIGSGEETEEGATAATTVTAMYVADKEGCYAEAVVSERLAGLYMAGKNVIEVIVEDGAASFKTITAMADLTDNAAKKYFVVDTDNELFVLEFGDLTSAAVVVSTVDTAVDEDKDTQLSVFYESCTAGTNLVCINFPYFDTMTLVDFVEMLNDSVLGKVFEFYMAAESVSKKYDYVTEVDTENSLEPGNGIVMNADRRRGYNYAKYLPFTTSDNFARLLAQSVTYTELKTFPSHGVIGVNRISDTTKTALAKKVKELQSYNWDLYVKNNFGRNMLNANNMPYPIGRNVSVTCFQEYENMDNYTTIMNGAAAYAGMISALDVARSSTAQPMDVEPMFEFSHSQLQTLSALGIITLKRTFTKGWVVTDGVTMADGNDLLRRLLNTRIMHFIEEELRAASEPFIGTVNSSANRNSLQTAINSRLSKYKDVLLRAYSFQIIDDGSADQFTYIDIDYTIVPYNEIREIRNFIHVKN